MTAYWDNGPVQLYQADARSIPLADQSVHCVVTSPPYFGLRVYKDNDDRGIGLEPTVEDYIGNLVEVFREVRRVLRDDGVAWLNLGDSYAGSGKGQNGDGTHAAKHGEKQHTSAGTLSGGLPTDSELESGNRLGIPERVVLALQADGWIWRDTIIWAKKSAMPESVNGWRWERCRVKIAVGTHHSGGNRVEGSGHFSTSVNESLNNPAQFQDCPGCPKCADNDGLVLRRGSWRTTQAHEYIYMLTKGMGYYADGEAVKTAATKAPDKQVYSDNAHPVDGYISPQSHHKTVGLAAAKLKDYRVIGANRRSVWNDISPEPYGGAHFATFPSDLPRICIQASTSERGVCSECGSQWARVVEREKHPTRDMEAKRVATALTTGREDGHVPGPDGMVDTTATVGWLPTCNHDASAIPATVLDPFSGTATTCRAAQKLGRRAVGVDISESYLEQAVRRLSAVTLPMGI